MAASKKIKMKKTKTNEKSSKISKVNKSGKGFIDAVIDKLPFEVHVPGYQYCGPGSEKKPVSFSHLVKNAKIAIKEFKPDNLNEAIKVAMASTRECSKGNNVRKPRSIKLPSIKGGILPLVPIFAGLGALGSIVGSAAGVANAINNVRKGQKELDESKRHNQTLEAIALGDRKGSGYYLQTFKKGSGYYLKRFPKNQ